IGILLGKGLVRLVTQSINDLYFVVSVRSLDIAFGSLLKGILLGIGATFFAALKPAREATSAPARAVLSRSLLESNFIQRIPVISLTSVLFLLAGAALLWLPGTNIYSSYSGIVILVFGFTLLTPVTILLIVRMMTPFMGRALGIFGRMAARDIMTQLSRINVAIAALSLAVATAVGVGTMIDSFRSTVVDWLEARLQADIFISAPSSVARLNDGSISGDFLPRLDNVPGIREIDYYREIEVRTGDDVHYVRGIDIEEHNFSGYRFKAGNPDELWQKFMANEAVVVSETYAFHRNLNVGSMIEINTDRGEASFKIAGIYYDYASDLGIVAMNYSLFRRYYDDDTFSGISLFLKDDADLQQVMTAVEARKKPDEAVIVMSQRALLDTSIEIFDRTFIITNVLQILAILVAFIGILSAFMALQLERRREFGILRANGMTIRQIWKLVSIQTALMGFIAGVLSLPLGNLLAWVLIYIINKRSFGWTLQFQFRPDLLVQAVLLAVVAAILAGIYPAWRMAHTSPAIAMREE
ncbi:FtsX-like permease family protein, partial [candidate division KSB1 bacterium]|nr:FtsX-like permease family protein [candidate division KSB1 bacterium]